MAPYRGINKLPAEPVVMILQKKGLAKKRTDVYNNKCKDNMSLIRERRLYENKEPGYNEQN